MCTYMHVYVYTYIYIYMHTYIHICTYIFMLYVILSPSFIFLFFYLHNLHICVRNCHLNVKTNLSYFTGEINGRDKGTKVIKE